MTSEKCKLTVHINTQDLKVDLAGIKIKLIARILLTDKKGYSREFKITAYFWRREGLEKGKEVTRNYEIDLRYALRNPEFELPSAMNPEERKIAMQVQGSSIGGKNARMEYYLDIRGEFDSCRCVGASGPSCRLGIFIRNQELVVQPVQMQAQAIPLGLVPERGYAPASVL